MLLLRALNSGDVTQPTFPAYQAGDYLLQWSGNGTWSYYFDAQGTCKTSPCKITISSPSGGGLWLILTSTTPGNTVKNVSLIYCGTWNGSACSNGYDTLLANGEMFNPTFINQIKAFKTLRFKDWMATADNFQTNWTDRPGENWVFWDGSRTNATINGASPSYLNDGVPAEVMFALCNEVEADCWFNMPPLATDDYVMQFATLAHSLLNRTSRVYVEYANEVWNQVFAPQQSGNTGAPLNTASVLLQLQALGHTAYPDLSGFSAAFQYGILRAVQVGADWKSAWGADAGRVIRLAAGQNGYPTRNNWILHKLAKRLEYLLRAEVQWRSNILVRHNGRNRCGKRRCLCSCSVFWLCGSRHTHSRSIIHRDYVRWGCFRGLPWGNDKANSRFCGN